MNKKIFPFGLELTFINKDGGRDDSRNVELNCAIRSRLQRDNVPHIKCDIDPLVCEVNTIAFDNVDTFKENVQKIHDIAKEAGGLPEADWTTGGGCHIHVKAFNGVKLNLLVYTDWAYRQATAYAFNHPCANTEYTQANRINPDYNDRRYTATPGKVIYYHPAYGTGKGCAVAYRPAVECSFYPNNNKPATIEFRFFRMPTSMQQHIDHVDFAQAYMRKVESLGVAGMIELIMARPLPTNPKDVSLEDALAQFRETIEWVGLPWKRYAKYAKNIKTRYAYQNCPEWGIDSYRNWLN